MGYVIDIYAWTSGGSVVRMKQLSLSDVKEIKKKQTLIKTHRSSIVTIEKQISQILGVV